MKILSSKTTFVQKFIAPSVTGIAIAYVMIYEFNTWQSTSYIMTAVVVALLIAFIYWFCIRAKKVSVSGETLFVSNYIKEIQIPLSNVEKVTTVYIKGHPTTIHLKSASEFGSKILFFPPHLYFSWEPHENVAELKRLVEAANKKY